VELLVDRRARGPAAKTTKRPAKRPAKKGARKVAKKAGSGSR
jgi:hypothetical protein